mmetsp:Transcript_13575/g.44062  ORF Transcript_13575/g.44062 Transcript_13575/m.44062 type:complete len:140 (-) Transcript_13575:273-692(-)
MLAFAWRAADARRGHSTRHAAVRHPKAGGGNTHEGYACCQRDESGHDDETMGIITLKGFGSAPRTRLNPYMAAERLVPLPCALPVEVQLQRKSLAIVRMMSEMFGMTNFETCQEEAAVQVLDSSTGEVGARAGQAQRRA